jgi:hypothetical protein
VARRLQKDGYGTGAAYTDVNGDGVLDVFISHGESSDQPLTFYSAKSFVNFSPSVHVTIINRAAYCPRPKWATGSI